MSQRHHTTAHDRCNCLSPLFRIKLADRGFDYVLGVHIVNFCFCLAQSSAGTRSHTRLSLSLSESEIATIMRGPADRLAAVTFPHYPTLQAIVAFGLRERRMTTCLVKACYMRGYSKGVVSRLPRPSTITVLKNHAGSLNLDVLEKY
jgi:hypothetical protein